MMATPDIAAIVAAVIATLGGEVPAAPAVTSAPAAPRVASPFTATKGGAAVNVATEAMRLYPHDRAAQRAAIAVTMAPGFTCSVDTTATLADGTEVPSALHGFTVRKDSGTPCAGIRGLAKDTACPGVIR
jgi:hypothetical protein